MIAEAQSIVFARQPSDNWLGEGVDSLVSAAIDMKQCLSRHEVLPPGDDSPKRVCSSS